MRPNEAAKTGAFLASLEFYPVTFEVAKYAGALYREWRQKRSDSRAAGSNDRGRRDYPWVALGDR